MSLTILRAADACWLGTPHRGGRIDTDATTTGQLLVGDGAVTLDGAAE